MTTDQQDRIRRLAAHEFPEGECGVEAVRGMAARLDQVGDHELAPWEEFMIEHLWKIYCAELTSKGAR